MVAGYGKGSRSKVCLPELECDRLQIFNHIRGLIFGLKWGPGKALFFGNIARNTGND